MKLRGVLPGLVTCFALVFAPGVATAHEVQAVVVPQQPEAVLGDEESDAMVTGSISPASSSSCKQQGAALKMPYADAGHPDEMP